MPDDLRGRMREALLKSYQHRSVAGVACAICGSEGVPLAFHVIEKSIPGAEVNAAAEQGFTPMSSFDGYVRGAFPLCTACAPPCRRCNLPTDPPSVHKFAISVEGKIGFGLCTEHIHWRYIFQGIVERVFGRY